MTKSTVNMSKTKLSAAESYVLLDPNGDNSRKALRLLLKEAAFRGHIRCFRGHRKIKVRLDVILAIVFGFLMFGLFIHNPLGFLLGFGIGWGVGLLVPARYRSTPELMLIELTQAGRDNLAKYKFEPGALEFVLKKVEESQNPAYQNCSFEELLRTIKQETPAGNEFLDQKILSPLVRRGLLDVRYSHAWHLEQKLEAKKKRLVEVAKSKGRTSFEADVLRSEYRRLRDMPCHHYKHTVAGAEIKSEIEQSIKTGLELPRQMRESPQAAGAMAFSLGALVLLLPDLEGRFSELMQLTNLHVNDGPWDEYALKEKADDNFSAVGSGVGGDFDEEDTEDNSDWDSSDTEFLDGGLDNLDSDFTSDSGDSGGDSGSGCDGGGGGDGGGGCGGCGGGGD
jgi:uncharacterized membrane protein YgcG